MYYFSLLIIIAFIFPTKVFAEEYLRGTVVSVNEQKGEAVIQPLEYASANVENDAVKNGNILVTVKLPRQHKMQQHHEKKLFKCLVPGQQIRMRGKFDTELSLFLASDIRGCGWRGGPDPTGIRGRLGRDCNKDRSHRRNFGRRCSPEKHRHLFSSPEQISEAERRLRDSGN